MAAPVGFTASLALRASALLALSGALAACGSGSPAGDGSAARAAREAAETAPQPAAACPGTVMHTLVQIAKHVYHEGISSERTRSAFKALAGSGALRAGIERGDGAAVQATARALIATGRITNLRVLRGSGGGEGAGEVLADAGGGAVAPLRGTLTGANGAAIARLIPNPWAAARDPALLRAVAARDPEATRVAIDNLLTEHIVRLRVSVGGRLLRDVGGPYVLAPVSGVLRAGDREIGTFVLSIQDDEGYLRLARRLGGMYVLMYMDRALVKNSLGPAPGPVPETGPFFYRGRRFEVFTVHASAFPSGPLRIKVLVPIPYA